jgi:hypothetical protein
MRNIVIISLFAIVFTACQKEDITFSNRAKDLFYVKNKVEYDLIKNIE